MMRGSVPFIIPPSVVTCMPCTGRASTRLSMHPEGVLGELVAQPPLSLARAPAEVDGPGLALDRGDALALRVAARRLVARLGDDDGNVARATFVLAARDDEPDRAEVDILLERSEERRV